MKTFTYTQKEINNLYCPQRTKPNNITKEQWSEAKEYWSEAEKYCLESQFINRNSPQDDPYSKNPIKRRGQILHDINTLIRFSEQQKQVSFDETQKQNNNIQKNNIL